MAKTNSKSAVKTEAKTPVVLASEEPAAPTGVTLNDAQDVSENEKPAAPAEEPVSCDGGKCCYEVQARGKYRHLAAKSFPAHDESDAVRQFVASYPGTFDNSPPNVIVTQK